MNIVSSHRFVLLSRSLYKIPCHTGWMFALEEFPSSCAENLTPLSGKVKMYSLMPSVFFFKEK